jgi:hypothetical protein
VTDKVGISPDQAQKAVATVLGFLKERMPAPLAGELDKIVGGGGGAAELGGVADAAKKLFG